MIELFPNQPGVASSLVPEAQKSVEASILQFPQQGCDTFGCEIIVEKKMFQNDARFPGFEQLRERSLTDGCIKRRQQQRLLFQNRQFPGQMGSDNSSASCYRISGRIAHDNAIAATNADGFLWYHLEPLRVILAEGAYFHQVVGGTDVTMQFGAGSRTRTGSSEM
ncbi:MAG: hypothetical protein WDZ76_12275 [Pseudohongiellaceae bacterium]